jgi:hypothetical protein
MFESLRKRFGLPEGWQPAQFLKPKVILSFAAILLAAAALIWFFDKVFCQRRRDFAAAGRSKSAARTQARRPPISGAFLLVAFHS